jgi:hypothetical protein
MRTRTKWVVAGGAAAFVLAPLVSVYGSTALDTDLQQSGVVVDADAANQARAARTRTEAAKTQPTGSAEPTVSPSTKASKKTPEATASPEPKGKKTVSAASPVSPKTSVSPVSPN